MEKYYIVTEESPLRKDYFKYIENDKIINEHVKSFMDEYGIEAHEYAPSDDTFYIFPTDKDIEKFGKILKENIGNGLRPFKKNSKVGKDWVKSLQENGLKVLDKPWIPLYFNGICGKHRTRLFHVGDIVYCSMEMNCDFDNPVGFQEIKASEFYKIIEDDKE